MKKSILATLLALGLSASMTLSARSILDIKQSITDDNIIAPESFETQTRLLEENFYIKNYVVPGMDLGEPQPASPAEYEERLKVLPTVIEMPYNSLVGNFINMYLTKKRTLVADMLALHSYYGPIFVEELIKEGMPTELQYLPVIESAINPNAISRAGAAGLWQFMPATAKGLGMEVNSLVDERRDARLSSRNAARYLKQLYDIYNDWSLAIAAYNCGPGNVNKALRRAGIEDKKDKDFWSIYYFLPQETRGYVPAFIAANYVMTYYNLHGISPALAKRPIITDSVHVSKRVNFNQISQVLNIPVEEIRVLNPQYRHDIIPGDIRPYSLVLPSMQVYSYIMSEDSIAGRDATLYARRSVVEPTSLEELENNGEFTTKLVVKTHKVKRGETLSGIAKKYGVSVSDIKKWNGMRKNSVPRGRNLKINTYERVRIEKPASDTTSEANTSERLAEASSDAEKAVTETVAAVASDTAKKAKKTAAPATQTKQKKSTSTSSTKSKGGFTNHKVKKGESLYRIAKAKGTTVEAIQKANGMSGSAIREGQTLKIPR